MDLTDVFLGILFGFILFTSILKVARESTFDDSKEKLTTKEVMKKLEQIEKTNHEKSNDKLLWFGLGALIGINLFD